MKKLIDQIDAKMIRESGAILLAGFCLFVLFKVLTNDLPHLNATMEKQTEVLSNLARVVEGNTEVLRIIERRLR